MKDGRTGEEGERACGRPFVSRGKIVRNVVKI
jgi:hypothetical protein